MLSSARKDDAERCVLLAKNATNVWTVSGGGFRNVARFCRAMTFGIRHSCVRVRSGPEQGLQGGVFGSSPLSSSSHNPPSIPRMNRAGMRRLWPIL